MTFVNTFSYNPLTIYTNQPLIYPKFLGIIVCVYIVFRQFLLPGTISQGQLQIHNEGMFFRKDAVTK